MTAMAAACGVLLVVLGLLLGSSARNEVQSLTQITCLLGGLLMFFVAVILSRLSAITHRLDGLLTPLEAATDEGVAQDEAEPDEVSPTLEPDRPA